jgi:hypothetical protein
MDTPVADVSGAMAGGEVAEVSGMAIEEICDFRFAICD